MRNMLSAAGRAWDRLEIFIGGLFLTLSVFIIVLQIFLRSVFGFSIIGGDEIAASGAFFLPLRWQSSPTSMCGSM